MNDVPEEIPPAPAAELRRIGDYQLLAKQGQGGMGVVYRALQVKLGKTVALKVLSPGSTQDPRALARFEREMKAVGRLNHPNIVQALDAREIEGTPILVMEYVEGMDLFRLVRHHGPLRVPDACELVRQAAVGLQYVHENGFIHRDIKPSNLTLTRTAASSMSPAACCVKILDLGLALLRTDQPGKELTDTGCAVGSVDYMAPEQIQDSHHVDIRADVYSLGCTLYKLLSGHAPFADAEHKGTYEKIVAQVQESPTPIRRFRGDVPPNLAAVLDRMMAKNPGDRYATPREAAEAVAPFAVGSDLATLLARSMSPPRTVPPEPSGATEDYLSSSFTGTPPSGAGAPGDVALQPATSKGQREYDLREQTTAAMCPSSLRRRRPVMLALLLAGILGGAAFGIVIWINHTRLEVPENSEVAINADGSVRVTTPRMKAAAAVNAQPEAGSSGEPRLKAKNHGVQAAHSELKVIKPWFPGAEPSDTPPQPPPGPPPLFAHEDLHQFLTKTFKPMRTPQLWRMLYTEIATTIDRSQPGRPATWVIGSALTSDGKAYEIAVRAGGWFPRVVPPSEAAEKGLKPTGTSRSVATPWRLPVKELVSLGDPELRLVQSADGGHMLAGRIRCIANTEQPIEHLALVIEFPSDKEDAISTLYQQYRITELPAGWLAVNLALAPTLNLKHAPRIYLEAFLAQPEAGFFRISNELLWNSRG